MINSFDRKNSILHAINEINQQLALKEIKITEQKTEIGKTEVIIAQCNNCLKSQNSALQVFLTDKQKLEEDKAKYQQLLNECDVVRSNWSQESLPIEVVKTQTNNPNLTTFSENCEILKTVKSLKFYRAISNQLTKIAPNIHIHYLNQNLIPNFLKTCTLPRGMIIHHIDQVGEYPLEIIINQPIVTSLDIHVSSGAAELLLVRRQANKTNYHNYPMESCKSYFIDQSQTVNTNFIILVSTAPMLLAIDILCPIKETPDILPEPEGYNFAFPRNSTKHYSFIKKNLSTIELHQKILFLDASFSKDINNDLVPIALTVLDYGGKIVINTMICPRTNIKDYLEKQHGLCEKDIQGTPDSEEILKYFYTVIWDKVLVGFGLQTKLRDLKIDEKYLCGVRDLESSPAYKKVLKKGEKTLSLDEAVCRILQQPPSIGIVSAEQNTHNIRRAYIKVEGDWSDSMSVFTPDYAVSEVVSEEITPSKSSRWDQPPTDVADGENGYMKRIRS